MSSVPALNLVSAKFTNRSFCALCRSSCHIPHREFAEIPVVRCTECGFIFSAKTMDAGALQDYYRETFGSERHRKGQRVNSRINSMILKRLLNLPLVRNWLDVGTGYGFLLKWLQDSFNVNTEGVELSRQESEYAKNNLGLLVHAKLLSECNLPRASFDVVSSFEVIEHVAEPTTFLSELAEYVRPGGQLVIMTDNFESRPVRNLKGSFPKWIPHTHISHFSASTLKKCIQQVPGLVLEKEASYTPWDTLAREAIHRFRSQPHDSQAYNVSSALATEMSGAYKLYGFRYLVNPVWARLNMKSELAKGALMYAVCRRNP